MNLSENISGKVVVITGASSGLGESTARLLASKGANVVLGARREESLKKIAEEINKQGNGKAVYLKTDVTVKSDVQALINKAISEFGKLDVLLNNAGLMSIAPLSEVNDYWNNNIKPDIKEPAVLEPKLSTSNDADLPAEEPHHLFDFLAIDKHEDGLIEALGGLLSETQGDDYEEQDFANKMKKKRKRQRGQK